MSYSRRSIERVSATEELRATLFRLIVVLSVAVSMAFLARLSLGPALF